MLKSLEEFLRLRKEGKQKAGRSRVPHEKPAAIRVEMSAWIQVVEPNANRSRTWSLLAEFQDHPTLATGRRVYRGKRFMAFHGLVFSIFNKTKAF